VSAPSSTSSKTLNFKYKIHWHVTLIHFPISFFVSAFVFQILHLIPHPISGSFEVASNVMLIIGTFSLILATWTGWTTWKRRYKGIRAGIFQNKINISFAMLIIRVPLTIWRTVFLRAFENVPSGTVHWLYFFGTILLMAGSVLEGFYGGRLNHR
jgi:uncharacterized membrane protein